MHRHGRKKKQIQNIIFHEALRCIGSFKHAMIKEKTSAGGLCQQECTVSICCICQRSLSLYHRQSTQQGTKLFTTDIELRPRVLTEALIRNFKILRFFYSNLDSNFVIVCTLKILLQKWFFFFLNKTKQKQLKLYIFRLFRCFVSCCFRFFFLLLIAWWVFFFFLFVCFVVVLFCFVFVSYLCFQTETRSINSSVRQKNFFSWDRQFFE